MIFGKESETLEFKKTTGELKEAVISIAAILNKSGKGELYFGILNNGKVEGQDIGDATLRDVSKALSDNLKPQIFPTIDMVSIFDRPYSIVSAIKISGLLKIMRSLYSKTESKSTTPALSRRD